MSEAAHSSGTFETGAISHAGKVRKANEDNLLVRPELGIWAVADGMGGHENGALASATVIGALETIGATASARDLLEQLEKRVLAANAELRREIGARGGATMGSTLSVLLAHHGHFACVWSGDSRIYLVRDGAIHQVSRDHTEVQDMVERGLMTPEEAKASPRRHIITRAIGVHDTPELDLENGEIFSGDAFVLCSDGLTEHVRDDEILLEVMNNSAQAACDALLALTLKRGASDNVTVIVVRYHGADPQRTRWMPNMRMHRTEAQRAEKPGTEKPRTEKP